jgi:hypothetical protein
VAPVYVRNNNMRIAQKENSSMPDKLSVGQLRLLRAAGQGLLDTVEPGDLTGVVGATVGINAQRTSAMMLSLRARMRGADRADITMAIDEERSLVRTWTMRGTLHLVDARDIRWLVAGLGPVTIAKTRRRRLELGLDDDLLTRALKEIKAVMSKAGAMTRWELADALARKGIVLEKKSQAPIHLIMYAALSGLMCLGPERENGEPTYVLLDQWVAKDKGEPVRDAITRLAIRYFKGYGPATLSDFSSWSGIPITHARDAWKSLAGKKEIHEVRVDGKSLWMISGEAGRPAARSARRPLVRLLPAFDAYVLAYSDRELLMPREMHARVYHGGQTLATIVVDGEVVGVWRYARKGKQLIVELSPFEPLTDKVRTLITAEVQDIGRFFGLEAVVKG